MKESLPAELLEVLERSATADFVTIDARGQPVAWPLTPRYQPGDGCIDVTVARVQADDPRVALLFSDDGPMVLVQGTAQVEDRGAADVDVHVLPERVYVWPGRDLEAEPQLYDAHVDEVRSAHNEEPEVGHARARGRRRRRGTSASTSSAPATPTPCWPSSAPTASPSPSGSRCAPTATRAVVLIDADPVGAPIEPGLACLCADAPAGAASTCSATSTRIAGVLGAASPPGRRRRAHPRRG